MSSTPMICCSSGWATVCSTTSASAPGNTAETLTCGGTMSGNWATGRRVRATRPATVITIEMTNARRGRSMKSEDIMS
jgi:hypothetical protein